MKQPTTKGFFGALFDFSFTHYVTPTIIRIIFGIVIVVSAVGALAVAIAAFSVNIVLGFFVLIIFGPLIFLVYVILYRVFLEVVMAVFTIAENTTKMVDAPARSGFSAPTSSMPTSSMPTGPMPTAAPSSMPPPPMPSAGPDPSPWLPPPPPD